MAHRPNFVFPDCLGCHFLITFKDASYHSNGHRLLEIEIIPRIEHYPTTKIMKKQLSLLTATAALISPTWADNAQAESQTQSGTESVAAATGGGEADFATQLANPLAALISMPIQGNYDENFGLDGSGSKWLVNVQPVIPFTLNDDWNVISRTIIPLIDQSGYTNSAFNESGLGDILQSVWASPSAPASNGWIWGVGGAFLFPTASDDVLGGGKWGVGPTVVALKQTGHWTYGGLTNHVSSFAGDSDRNYINSTFIQPFLTYITDTKTTFALNSESSFDWRTDTWNIPINLMVNQMIKVGGQPMQLQVGARYWAASPHEEQENSWGFRCGVTFLFPK